MDRNGKKVLGEGWGLEREEVRQAGLDGGSERQRDEENLVIKVLQGPVWLARCCTIT